MANHCIDVICLDCGRSWCARGCNDRGGPSKESVKRFLKSAVERAAKYHQGVLERAITLCSNETCACGSKRVAMD